MSRSAKEKHGKRRLANARIKAKAARVAKANGVRPEHYTKIADHLATCSGPCCGNRRRYEGRGLDEIRHQDSMREAMLEDI